MFHKTPFSGPLKNIPTRTPEGFCIRIYDATREADIDVIVPLDTLDASLVDTFAGLRPGTEVHGDSTRDISGPQARSVATKITALELSLASFQNAITRKTMRMRAV